MITSKGRLISQIKEWDHTQSNKNQENRKKEKKERKREKPSNVDSFLCDWELINELVKPPIANQLEKCGLPSALQVCLKMVLKAPVIDH